jgi:hypothetical protein
VRHCLHESQGKVLHSGEPLSWLFGQGSEEHIFDLRRKIRECIPEGGRRTGTVLIKHLKGCSLKGSDATQPFVHHNAQGILITGRVRFPLDLLRSHIWNSATETLGAEGTGNGRGQCNAKVAEHQFTLWPDEHVLWFDIPVDHAPLMRILECIGQWFKVGCDLVQGQTGASGMTMVQGPAGSIVHDQVGDLCGADAKVKQLHNMRVSQTKGNLGLTDKSCQVFIYEREHLHCDVFSRLQVFAQVDFAKGARTE